MFQRRILSNHKAYFGLTYFLPCYQFPPLEYDCDGIVGKIGLPLWAIERWLFWTVHDEVDDGYRIWRLRKQIYSDVNINKACEYIETLHPIMTSICRGHYITLDNTPFFTGISYVESGRIDFGGFRCGEVSDVQYTKLLQDIDTITETYFKFVQNNANNVSSDTSNE